MPAFTKVCVTRRRDPPHVRISGITRVNQHGNPGKSADALIRNGYPRRLRVHIVDGCDNLLGTIVADPDRDRIGDSRSGSQKHQRETGNEDRCTHLTIRAVP